MADKSNIVAIFEKGTPGELGRLAKYFKGDLKEITAYDLLGATHLVGNMFQYPRNNITSITIPASVTSTAEAFNRCSNLKTIRLLSKTPNIVFGFIYTLPYQIIVPKGCGEAYKSYWSDTIVTGTDRRACLADLVVEADE